MPASRLGTISLIMILLSTSLLLAACTRRSSAVDQAGDVNLNWEIHPSPAVTGAAAIEISLTDASGVPVRGARLSLRGDMTHAGMMPVMTDLRETDPGVYRGEIEWTMGGAWILNVEGELKDGRTLKRQIDIEVSP
jgi:hypothetical protein